MELITSKDELVEGEVYVTYNDQTRIKKYSKESKIYINVDKNQIFRISNGVNDLNENFYGVRKATPQEKQWLNECIRLNKYIPLNEVKVSQDNYQIY